MGRPKALLPVDDGVLVQAHCAVLQAFGPVIVVLGDQADVIRSMLPEMAHCVMNPDWSTTHPADSVQLALAACPSLIGVLVSPVDVPPVDPEVAASLWGRKRSAVPRGPDGQDGHPVWLAGEALERARDRAHPRGLRGELEGADRVAVAGVLPPDFDDWVSFEAWRATR